MGRGKGWHRIKEKNKQDFYLHIIINARHKSEGITYPDLL